MSESRGDLETLWAEADAQGAKDPFTNPYLLFARALNTRLEAGDMALAGVETAIQSLSAEGACARADRLKTYLRLDDSGPDHALGVLFERLADAGYEAFAAALSNPSVGLVTTGHPTFALSEPLSLALVELATGRDEHDAELDAGALAEREAAIRSAPHGPPPIITLDVEHAWSMRALGNTADALDRARRVALGVARRRWPDRWTGLNPALMTLATWVGFDQDGRSDVTWVVSLGKRLALKQAALRRYLAMAEPLGVANLTRPLQQALALVDRQVEALSGATDDPASVAAFSRQLVADRADSLVDPAPLLATVDAALSDAPDDDARETLIVLRANLQTQGVCLAHIHVRLNSSQLHNAIRREAGLDTSPSDPSNRRTYIQTANALIENCRPVEIGFQSLLAETSSAKRLFMTIAQMAKYVDAASPVRFLIAETESGFTLLVAQYFARLFGVEGLVELSPLFETEEGLDRGEVVIEEAMRSPHFRQYLQAQGRLALEFGFSDSGRFIGQMAATFRIERLRLRIAELMEREKLTSLQLILFNTHGESIGRGGHPASLMDRLLYAAPPRDRLEFGRRGIRVREEDSFQGGEGYLPLFIPATARATVAGMLAFALSDSSEAVGDPIYDAPDFAAEFFATIQQAFTSLAGDPDYAALLSLFGTRLLPKTGSRPEQRQSSETGAVKTFTHVSELRAIPNNGILQGLGDLVNVTFGLTRAMSRHPEPSRIMRETSPRFRRAMQMAETAASFSDLQSTRAYAATLNPSLWLDLMADRRADESALRALAQLAEKAAMTGRMSDVLRRIRNEPGGAPVAGSVRRDRLRLLHALRIALIQRCCILATQLPPFTPRGGFDRPSAQLQIMRLDIPAALQALAEVFPLRPDPALTENDFGEAVTYTPSEEHGYEVEHRTLFQPLAALHALLLRTTTALGHECGACG